MAAMRVSVVIVPVRLVNEVLSVWASPDGDGRYSLPIAELGLEETESQAVAGILKRLPFAEDVRRTSSCGACTDPARVGNGREIALVSWAAIRPSLHRASDNGNGTVGWHPLESLPPLRDDHREIVMKAVEHLQGEILHDPVTRRLLPRHLLRSTADAFGPESRAVERSPILFCLLPDPFPLSAIRRFYESIVSAPIDRGNFRRKLVELRPTGVVKELPIFQRGVRHRAAQLFTFDPRAWERWASGGE